MNNRNDSQPRRLTPNRRFGALIYSFFSTYTNRQTALANARELRTLPGVKARITARGEGWVVWTFGF